MRLGVDFGTTNSAIALYDGHQLHTILADPANDDNPYVLPSLLYIDRSHHVTVGAQAADAYLQQETGRPVRWRQRDAGEIEITVASVTSVGGDPIEFVQPIHVLVDDAANGRLIQSIKTALFNTRYEGTQVFDRFYRIDDLIAIILRRLKTAAEREIGASCTDIVLGRPVRFSDDPFVDSRAESILLKAAHLAGFQDVRFEKEPVGVAYLHHRNSPVRQTILVFDFGGGTLDLTIADVGGDQEPVIRATGGLALGGNDLDRRIMESLLPYFGGGDDGVLPVTLSDKLLAWQTMPELSRPSYLEVIHRLKRNGHYQTMETLETLISRNVGFKLFKEIERVKKALSKAESAVFDFEFENIHITEILTRRRFDRMIANDLDHIAASIEAVLQAANLKPRQIDAVLRTGGSSLIPAMRQLLADIFGERRIQAIDPLVSVTGGVAVVAYEGGSQPAAPDPETLITHIETDGYATYTTAPQAQVYTDRDFVINRIPPMLNKLPALRPANNDYTASDEAFLRFHLSQPARVYVAYEAAARQIPHWLRVFNSEKLRLEIEDAFARIRRTMQVYSRDYPAGEVVLGGTQADGADDEILSSYLVFVEPLPAPNGDDASAR